MINSRVVINAIGKYRIRMASPRPGSLGRGTELVIGESRAKEIVFRRPCQVREQ